MSEEEAVATEKGDGLVAVEEDDVHIAMDAEMFKDFFNLMSTLIDDEVQVRIEEDGLHLRQMESVRIALIDMFIPISYFKDLKKGEKIQELRLPVSDFKSILARLSHGDVIDLTVRGGRIIAEIKGRRIRRFTIPLFENEDMQRRVPTIPFEVKVKTSLEGLLIGIEDAEALLKKKATKGKRGEPYFGQVSFLTTPLGLNIRAMDDSEPPLRTADIILTSGWDMMQFKGTIGKQVNVAIAYLIPIVKTIAKVTNMIQVEYSQDMPLHIIAEMPLRGVALEFWIAPRIRVESEEVKAK